MIFYLSATGNTKWAAQQLAAATGEELIWMPDAMKGDCHYEPREDERIGFCFPVHGWRPPLLVRQFIQKLEICRRTYTYAVVTAGDNIGETISILRADLQKKQLDLDSAFSLLMPESYVGLPFMDIDKPEKETDKKQKAAEELAAYLNAISNREKGVWRLKTGRWPRVNSRVIGGFFVKKLITDKPFHVRAEACIRCGKCAEVCPIHNITGGKGQAPQWKHDGSCLTCFACYHHCPKHAIEFGNKTRHKGQYFFSKNK